MANINNSCNQYSYPYYFAYGMSANQTNFPHYVWTKVLFDTKISDPNTVCVNGTVTFPLSGIWRLGAFVNITGHKIGSNELTLSLPTDINGNEMSIYTSIDSLAPDPLGVTVYFYDHGVTPIWVNAGTVWDVALRTRSQSGLDDMTILATGANKPTMVFGYLCEDVPVELR